MNELETYDVIVCGARTAEIGRQPSPERNTMESMDKYRVRMLFKNPGPRHTTAFFDREKLERLHILYDEQLIYAQDYGMWMTVSRYGRVCILPEVLGLTRKHAGQISKVHREQQIQCDKMTQRKLLTELLGDVTDEELDLHYIHSTGFYWDAVISPDLVRWYDRLIEANDRRGIYNRKLLKRQIEDIKLRLVYQTVGCDTSRLRKAACACRYLSVVTIARWMVSSFRARLRRARNLLCPCRTGEGGRS